MMLVHLKNILIVTFAFQIICQGRPLKESFRGRNTDAVRKQSPMFRKPSHARLKKQPIKNALGKSKSSFDFDYDDVISEHGYRNTDSKDILSFYQPETGIEKMHVRPIDDNHSVRIKDPHLRYEYSYSDSRRFSHEPHKRVDSYAGEMIDDENTLSNFIAPPVFESHKNKKHEEEANKILYGTPEAQSAENANTKTFLASLNSLMSPLPLSNDQEKPADYEEPNDDQKTKSNVEYNGGYRVANNNGQDSEHDYERDYGNNDDRRFYHEGHTYGRGGVQEDYERQNYGEGSPGHHEELSHDAEEEERRDDRPSYHRKWNDDYDQGREDGKYDGAFDEDGGHNDNAETRSSENHEASNDRYKDDDTTPDYHNNEDYHNEQESEHFNRENNTEERQYNGDQGGEKPIEVVQDNAGKLHPMGNNISNEELNNEVQKYVTNNHRN